MTFEIQTCHPNDLFPDTFHTREQHKSWSTVERINDREDILDALSSPSFSHDIGTMVRVLDLDTFQQIYIGAFNTSECVDVSKTVEFWEKSEDGVEMISFCRPMLSNDTVKKLILHLLNQCVFFIYGDNRAVLRSYIQEFSARGISTKLSRRIVRFNINETPTSMEIGGMLRLIQSAFNKNQRDFEFFCIRFCQAMFTSQSIPYNVAKGSLSYDLRHLIPFHEIIIGVV